MLGALAPVQQLKPATGWPVPQSKLYWRLTSSADSTDLFVDSGLSPAIRDAAFCQVVRGDLDGDGVAAQDADIVLAHLAADVGGHDVAVFEFDSEGGVGKRLDDGAFHFDVVFFRH